MRPTQLHAAGMILEIDPPWVTTLNPAEDRPQQRHQYLSTPRGGHRIEDQLLRYEHPNPPLVAVGAPTRLVHMQHRLVRQLLLQLLTGPLDRLADFLPSFLGAPQTHLQAPHIGQHGFHQPSRHPTNHRPVGDQRRQVRSKVPADLLRQRRLGGRTSTSAVGIRGRWCPGCPSWPPGLRWLLCLRPRGLCSPAKPSEEGGLEELVEFRLRSASCRSKSAICFSCSLIFFWASASSFSSSAMRSLRFWSFSRSRSNSRRRNLSEDRGRLEPSFAATRRAVLAIIQHKLTHSPEFVQPKCRET